MEELWHESLLGEGDEAIAAIFGGSDDDLVILEQLIDSPKEFGRERGGV